MAWTPISGTMTQYQKSDGDLASSYYLKFYKSGTTTAFNMATDSTGGTTLAKCQLDSSGYPTTDGTTRFIPHVDQKYKVVLYKNATDADANTTGNADWVIDAVDQVQVSTTDAWVLFSGAPTQTSATTFTLTGDQTATFTAGTRIKADDSSTLYGIVTASAFTTLTTVTVTLDSGSLSGSLSAVYTGLSTTVGQEISADTILYNPLLTGSVNRVLMKRLEEVVYCKEFGAKFDGSTDDTVNIQKALDSGKSIVLMSDGHAVISGVLNVPNFVNFFGQGTSTVSSTKGTTLLYSGTGECINSTGTQDVVPFVKNTIGNFRVRKTTQASTKAAIALISGAGVYVDNIRIDTDSDSYNFKYGVVLDQTEVSTVSNLDVQGNTTSGKLTASVFCTNGAQYTVGNSTNFTNVNTIINLNSNSADYGILHDGGEGFKVVGGNINGSHTASVRLAGLNSFCLDTVYMEGSSGTADILVAQLTSDAQSVGAGGGGTIKNCRLASTTTNCIKFENASVQSDGHSIYGNKFGSGRTGAAISTTLADGIRGSWIGPNVNLGGSGKDYLDASIYLHNTVHVSQKDQQESKQGTFAPGGLITTNGSGRTKNTTHYNRTTGTPYVVLDTDDILFISNNAGATLDLTLPSGSDQDGRELTVVQILGTDTVNVSSWALNAVGDAITIVYDHANTTWHRVSSIGV